MSNRRVCVLGAGAWGTALAALLARNGAQVRLWGRDANALAQIAAGENRRYLPGIALPAALAVEAELARALDGAQWVLIATPCAAFVEMLRAVAEHAPGAPLVWACKGLDSERGEPLDRRARAVLGERAVLAVVSGPTFAAEVARDLPTAMTLAADSLPRASVLAAHFHGGHCRVYASDDLSGVQLAGAIKNVYAIAAGISDALGFGANARAALVTRSLAEMGRLGAAMGARAATLNGLAGLGDLLLTCTDDQSRNRRFGLALGAGRGVEQALAGIGQAVEGLATARRARALGARCGVELPIVDQVVRVLDGDCSAHQAVQALLARQARAELD